jgi:hypothetical protein
MHDDVPMRDASSRTRHGRLTRATRTRLCLRKRYLKDLSMHTHALIKEELTTREQITRYGHDMHHVYWKRRNYIPAHNEPQADHAHSSPTTLGSIAVGTKGILRAEIKTIENVR